MSAAPDMLALGVLLAALALPVSGQIALRAVLRPLLPHAGRARPLARTLYRIILAALIVFAAAALWLGEARAGCEALVAVLCLGLCATDAKWYWLPLPSTLALLLSGLILAIPDDRLPERLGGAIAVIIVLEALRAAFRYRRGIEAMGGGDVILGAGLAAHVGVLETSLIFTVAAAAALGWALCPGLTSGTVKTPLGAWLCLAFLPVLGGLSYY